MKQKGDSIRIRKSELPCLALLLLYDSNFSPVHYRILIFPVSNPSFPR